MAALTSSRFALLTVDVSDPFAKKSKVKDPTAAKDKAPGKTAATSSAQQKRNLKSTSSTKKESNGGAGDSVQANKSKNKGYNNAKSPAWEEWVKRDSELTNGNFELELKEAITQSKLDFQKQQETGQSNSSNANAKKKKKKKAPVPLNEFSGLFSSGPQQTDNKPSSVVPEEESLLEQLRLETEQEFEEEKRRAAGHKLLLARNAKFDNGNTLRTESSSKEAGDEKSVIISQLKLEKQNIQQEIERCKNRFKKLMDLMNDTEISEKVRLSRDIEKLTEFNQDLTKFNQDLNEELRGLNLQLEQERSKSHCALIEVKKIAESSRRRTQSHNDN